MDAAAERAHQAFLTWKGVGYADRADITPDNPAYRTEFFEPVAQIYRVKDEAEAITLANDPPTVWVVRSSRATSSVARQLETGRVCINHPTGVVDIDGPF